MKTQINTHLNASKVQVSDFERSKAAKQITWVGFVVNAILTGFKLFAGVQGHSAAMIADAVHSLSDFFTDVVVLVGFKLMDKPADEQHNYGHGKYETLATVIISFALALVGYKILSSGVVAIHDVIFHGLIIAQPGWIALVAAISSIIGKEILFRYTDAVGKRIQSPAVIANGWHHRSDAFSSIGTMIGIGGAILLGQKWTILDPIASVIVSFFIFKVAFEILGPAINELMESSLEKEDLIFIENTICDSKEIVDFHHLRTRKVGARVAIEVHLLFEATMTIDEAHMHASVVEQKLKQHFGVGSILTTHLEPNTKDHDVRPLKKNE